MYDGPASLALALYVTRADHVCDSTYSLALISYGLNECLSHTYHTLSTRSTLLLEAVSLYKETMCTFLFIK